METRRLGNEIERREDEIEDGDCEIRRCERGDAKIEI
jgi:hypothetical protein